MSDPERLLAELHAARSLIRGPAPAPARPTTAALWAFAMRDPAVAVDLATARAVRDDPEAGRRYRTLLAARSLAYAPFAIAASDGDIRSRRVGAFTLDIVPGDGDSPPLVVIRSEDRRTATAIEVALGSEALRLALPPPTDGAWLLALDPVLPEARRLGELLAEPSAAVYLL